MRKLKLSFLVFGSLVLLVLFNNFGAALFKLTLGHPGNVGAFDPSTEGYEIAPGYKYPLMSYSSASTKDTPLQRAGISVRTAISMDGGLFWYELSGRPIFESSQMPLQAPSPPGTWNYEVSSLVYDAGAPVNERWKLFAHRYLSVGETSIYALGWIALKTSPGPFGPWSAERKFLTGNAYLDSLNVLNGLPENQSGKSAWLTKLSDCKAFTERGAFSNETGLYLSINCATGSPDTDRIVLLKQSRTLRTWEYVGILFDRNDAIRFDASNLSASDLFKVGSKTYVSVSPEREGSYSGCRIFQIEDLSKVKFLTDSTGSKKVIAQISPIPNANLSGACTYDEGLTQSGVLTFGRFAIQSVLVQWISIFATFVKL